jgi:hypothetical protein
MKKEPNQFEDPFEKSKRSLEKKIAEHKSLIQSAEYKEELNRLHLLTNDFTATIKACLLFTTRNKSYFDKCLFLHSAYDILETAIMIQMTVKEGARNPARRELRYLIELSVKTLFVDQEMPESSLENRLIYLKQKVKPSGISDVNRIRYFLLPEDAATTLRSNIIDSYARSSQYVHLSISQVNERLSLYEKGITLGFDDADELNKINDEIFEVYSLTLISLFHSIGRSNSGDLFEGVFSEMPQWSFHWHPLVAKIDEGYDQKAERKERLVQIRNQRSKRIQKDYG